MERQENQRILMLLYISTKRALFTFPPAPLCSIVFRIMKVLRIGTRGSPLALAQSGLVAARLERAARAAGLPVEVRLIEISTLGDRDRKTALNNFGGAGVFVKELETALLNNDVDVAVHSLKDMPVKQPRGLIMASVAGREDVHDALILPARNAPKNQQELVERLTNWPAKAALGCGSPRRRALLSLRFPKLHFVEFRGNVDTRLRKVAAGEVGGTLLARAGLVRLGHWPVLSGARNLDTKNTPDYLKNLRAVLLPLNWLPPAPGQGALALECRTSDRFAQKITRLLHDPIAAACVEAERACLEGLGGGCHLPLGAFAALSRDGKTLRLRAVLASANERTMASTALWGDPRYPKKLGQRAAARINKLLARIKRAEVRANAR